MVINRIIDNKTIIEFAHLKTYTIYIVIKETGIVPKKSLKYTLKILHHQLSRQLLVFAIIGLMIISIK